MLLVRADHVLQSAALRDASSKTRIRQGHAYPVSDTYPIRIHAGYGQDTYPRRVRVSQFNWA